MADILVYCEFADGKVKSTARELLGKARQLADGGAVVAALFANTVGDAGAELGAWGADKIVSVEHAALDGYVPGAHADALKQLVASTGATVVLGSATALGKDLLPRAAALCGAGLASDVTDLRLGAGGVEATRPMYSGKCLVNVTVNSAVKFFSVRPNSFVFESLEAGAGAAEAFAPELAGDYGYKVVEIETSGGGTVDLAEATHIISGGRAMKNADNFAIIHAAAAPMGAAVGASRAAVDAGYAIHSMQVGQTGKTVNPQLYIACGISGAIQHLAGMRTSKTIVAINKDPDAPIFQHATYGIVADLFEAVPLLEKEVTALLAQ